MGINNFLLLLDGLICESYMVSVLCMNRINIFHKKVLSIYLVSLANVLNLKPNLTSAKSSTFLYKDVRRSVCIQVLKVHSYFNMHLEENKYMYSYYILCFI